MIIYKLLKMDTENAFRVIDRINSAALLNKDVVGYRKLIGNLLNS